MKKYLVIGNPIEHSLSPKLHNYWIKINNIDAIYEKEQLNDEELESIIFRLKKNVIHGINVTVPFKNKIIPYLDELSPEAKKTKSVNTIYTSNNQIIGHNTDIAGFELSLKKLKYEASGKKILIIGAGGVVPSIIFALNRMNVSKITVTNRTKEKAEKLKDIFKELTLADWGDISDFDMIINATSVGLNTNEKIDLDLSKVGQNKFFYDVIYNPGETNFLKTGKDLGNRTENGKFMFIYQAHQAFTIWHKLMPKINDEVINIVTND